MELTKAEVTFILSRAQIIVEKKKDIFLPKGAFN